MPKKEDARSGDPAPAQSAPASGERESAQVDMSADTAMASPSEMLSAGTDPTLAADGHSETELGEGAEEAATAVEQAVDTLVGTVLEERYEITARLGQGGMGAVYAATHMALGKRVAVKVLLDKYAQKDKVVARLEQEARLASSIGHANIIDITDFGQTADGRTFVVMELLAGESLGACIARVGTLAPERAIKIAKQVASALGAAHEKNIIHRDIKPENIFLQHRDEKDFVKVVDFGISKSLRAAGDEESPRLTQTGMVLGTPLYMSPEQARGDEEVDHRIDIYALGVILYEMVTGEVPFRGSNYLNVLSQVMSNEPTPPAQLMPELGHDIESVILKAMAKDPDERYQTMAAFEADLATLDERYSGVNTTGARITAARWRRRRAKRRGGLRTLYWAAGLAVLVAAVAVTVSVLMRGESKPSTAATAPAVVPATPDAAPPPPSIDAAPAAPAIEQANIRIESIPEEGADVYIDDRYEGQTPLVLRPLKKDKTIRLSIEKDGFAVSVMELNPFVDDGRTIQVRLKKPEKGRPSRPRHRRPKDQNKRANGSSRTDDTAGGDLTGNPWKRK